MDIEEKNRKIELFPKSIDLALDVSELASKTSQPLQMSLSLLGCPIHTALCHI